MMLLSLYRQQLGKGLVIFDIFQKKLILFESRVIDNAVLGFESKNMKIDVEAWR